MAQTPYCMVNMAVSQIPIKKLYSPRKNITILVIYVGGNRNNYC